MAFSRHQMIWFDYYITGSVLVKWTSLYFCTIIVCLKQVDKLNWQIYQYNSKELLQVFLSYGWVATVVLWSLCWVNLLYNSNFENSLFNVLAYVHIVIKDTVDNV